MLQKNIEQHVRSPPHFQSPEMYELVSVFLFDFVAGDGGGCVKVMNRYHVLSFLSTSCHCVTLLPTGIAQV